MQKYLDMFKTKPAHPNDWWHDSPEYKMAVVEWSLTDKAARGELFSESAEFRNARHAYRKRVNHSWDKEST